jgi:hypothetical protein
LDIAKISHRLARVAQKHQTTLRFSPELWFALQRAAAEQDVSTAQYVRDAARARLQQEGHSQTGQPANAREQTARGVGRETERAYEHMESSAALWEQGRVARERARLLKEQSRTARTAR